MHHLLLLRLPHHVARVLLLLLLRMHLLLWRHPHHGHALHGRTSAHLLHPLLLHALLVHGHVLLLLLGWKLAWRHPLALHELLWLHWHRSSWALDHLALHHFSGRPHLRAARHRSPLDMDHALRVLHLHLLLLLWRHCSHWYVSLGMLLWLYLLLLLHRMRWLLLTLLLLTLLLLPSLLLRLHVLLLLGPVVLREDSVLPVLLPRLLQDLLHLVGLLGDPGEVGLVLFAQLGAVLLHGALLRIERLKERRAHTATHTPKKRGPG